ncbi:MAG TPA: hypothetical protein VFD58_07270 [Blastocatellia bacterium]|nr:hypothetical protein [Blastocatellia bacterium]
MALLLAAVLAQAGFVCGTARAQAVSNSMTISTVVGGGYTTSVAVRQAPMTQPTAVARDPQGRGFYVIDEINSASLLRFVNTTSQAVTLAGVTIQPNSVNLVGGGGFLVDDGISPRVTDLVTVSGLAVDPSGDVVYLAIPGLGVIRAINVGTQSLTVLNKTIEPGKITTIYSPSFSDFHALAVKASPREFFFISDRIVYRIDQAGVQSAYAGGGAPATGNGDGGAATQAKLTAPLGLALDGSNLLIAEGGDTRNSPGAVRKVDGTGKISSLATKLAYPNSVTVAPDGNAYVSLGNGQQIIRVTQAGATAVVAGNANICIPESNPTCGDGGSATGASLNLPGSTDNVSFVIAADASGLLLPDYRYARVRYINLSASPISIAGRSVNAQQIDTVTGSGQPTPFDNLPATASELNGPTGIVADAQGNLFIADTGNNRLRFVNRGQSAVTLFQGTVSEQTVPPGQIVTVNKNLNEQRTDDRITTAGFDSPQGMVLTDKGIFITDAQDGTKYPSGISGRRTGVIRFLNTSNANVTFFPGAGSSSVVVEPGMIKLIVGVPLGTLPPQQNIGDGGPANKAIIFPTDVAVDGAGNIYVADQGNNLIRKVDAATGIISSVQAKQPDGSVAALATGGATGIAFDGASRLLVADTKNDRVLRQNEAGGNVFTVIGDSTLGLSRPRDLAADSFGRIFVTSAGASKVIQLRAAGNALGTAKTVAGTGTPGFSGDGGAGDQAQLSLPNPGTAPNDIQVTSGLAVLPGGDLVFPDGANNRIRLLAAGILSVASVSAANYGGGSIASESIVAAFGNPLATSLGIATTVPLPTELAGTTVRVKDSTGTERPAPLFFVSTYQVNYQVPPGTAAGIATVTITSGDGTASSGSIQIDNVKPGFFSADSSGGGLASALVLRVKADNSLAYEPMTRYDDVQKKIVAVPVDLGPASDQVFLVMYGTGLRGRSQLSNVTAKIGGTDSEVLYAGPQGYFVGLDQFNLRVPRSLAGRGEVDIIVTLDGKAANTVKVNIK